MHAGVTLIHHGGPDREVGLQLLASTREIGATGGFSVLTLPIADIHIAQERARVGDLDGAIELSRAALDGLYESGDIDLVRAGQHHPWLRSLVQRGHDGDLDDAQSVMDRLAAVRTDPGFVLHDITLLRLRTQMARARGDEDGYRKFARPNT